MRKTVLLLLAIIVAVFATATIGHTFTVKSEEQVIKSAPAYQENEMLRAVKETKANVNALGKKTAKVIADQKKLIKSQADTEVAVTSLSESVTGLTKEVEKVGIYNKLSAKTVNDKVDNLNKRIRVESNFVADTIVSNFRILVAVFFFGILGLIIFIVFQNNKNISSIRSAAKEGTITGLKSLDEKISNLPRAVAESVNAFDPTPFTYNIEGKRVECNFAVPEDECYLTLKIENMNSGSQNPADFERQALDKHKRGLAAKYVRGTMVKFLKGGLTGTEEEKLIKFLQLNGAIKIS